jgi:hypothetical protein
MSCMLGIWFCKIVDWPYNLCNTLGLSYGTCLRIMSEELNMRIVVKFVPQILQNDQKQHCLEVCKELNNSFKRIQTFFWRLSLAPCDFFLFPKMKIELKGQRFDTVEESSWNADHTKHTKKKKHS